MKSSYIRKLFIKYIANSLPGFSLRGHLIYDPDYEWILRGFCFEDSTFSEEAFNIYIFVQPLFVPNDYLWFNFGNRLNCLSERGADRWWKINPENEPEIMNDVLNLIKGPGLEFISKVKNPEDILSVFRKRGNRITQDRNILETLAYSEVLIQDYQKACLSLNELLLILENDIKKHPEAKWLIAMKERVLTIYQLTCNKDYASAYQQLLAWRDFTDDALKLK